LNIPNADQAVIEPTKLRDYLLSLSHPIGRFKASFFVTLGYSQEEWAELENDLREQHLAGAASEVVPTDYGMKYVIRANLKGPNGKTAALVSVWIVLKQEDFPRFVTAYPGEA
jgi:hypothetical protein